MFNTKVFGTLGTTGTFGTYGTQNLPKCPGAKTPKPETFIDNSIVADFGKAAFVDAFTSRRASRYEMRQKKEWPLILVLIPNLEL
jgi:hypothetical protein